ncbi:MAG: fibrinogen-like YCDxxxxGGGW domain-containing protein [Deltaproteobacteria bacterium]|nr:fibrinogen-like YCDxxxxGGGW domain-containing protein [Deltaproteobacteria bacterium]
MTLSALHPRNRLLSLILTTLPLAACSDSGEEATPQPPKPPEEELKEVAWDPQFAPDLNTLKPRPGVVPATAQEQAMAVVKADSLEFPMGATSVMDWQPGKIVAAAAGGPTNPLGFARKVVKVEIADGKVVVQTAPVQFWDVVEGELRVRGDTQGDEVDVSQLDPAWVMDNLYPEADLHLPPIPQLRDNPTLLGPTPALPGSGLCCGLDSGGAAAKSLDSQLNAFETGMEMAKEADAGTSMMEMPSGFRAEVERLGEFGLRGRVAFNSEVTLLDFERTLFKDWTFKKKISKRVPLEVFLKGTASIRGRLKINPGFQVSLGAALDKVNLATGTANVTAYLKAAVDTRVTAMAGIKAKLEAGIAGADLGSGFEVGKQLEKSLERGTEAAQNALNDLREDLFENKDSKPEGMVKKTLWRSRPKVIHAQAGPVPVEITATLQLDLYCSFQAKASIDADVELNSSVRIRQALLLVPFAPEGKKLVLESEEPETSFTKKVEILGSGEISVGCGLAPRINILVYDGIGVYAGARGGLEATAAFESKCHETRTQPKGEASVTLKAKAGAFVGGRIQVPGSSFAGKLGLKLGYDTPELEPWNDEWELWKKTWDVDKGIGYCTPLCSNKALDDVEKKKGKETDIDCGGGACSACVSGKKCVEDSDCVRGANCTNGVCGVSTCANGRKDGRETDVDCGGSCQACATGKSCVFGVDCASYFCSQKAKLCVASSCEDGIQSALESDADCGGPLCGKCEANNFCREDSDCKQVCDGLRCVENACEDRRQNQNESDVDCGGTSTCFRCGTFRKCKQPSDCQSGLVCSSLSSGSGEMVCIEPPPASCFDGEMNGIESDVDCGGSCAAKCRVSNRCKVNEDCETLSCFQNRCAVPNCFDGIKNGFESDVDCGPSCPQRCPADAKCTTGSDCASSLCMDGTCRGRYKLSLDVSGLKGEVVLSVNGGTRVVQTPGVVFVQELYRGNPFDVKVITPANGQTCMVTDGIGIVDKADVVVRVTCSDVLYRVGGNIFGLVGSVVLANNNGDDLNVANAGVFEFAQKLPFGTPYAVSVKTQPAGQHCNVMFESGVATTNVANIQVECFDNRVVGGSVAGLNGSLVLRNNNAASVTVSSDGAFMFLERLMHGSPYAVTVAMQPSGQTCSVSNGTGTANADVFDVSVTCVSNPRTIGGTISGLTGSLVLRNNGGDDLTVSQTGSFVFATSIAHGLGYAVTIRTQPVGQVCVVTNGTGSATNNVVDVAVSCSSLTYTLGGTVSGLVGSVTLQNNAANPLVLSANGSFAFAGTITHGSTYNVTVRTQPATVRCTVANGTGELLANTANIVVTCAPPTSVPLDCAAALAENPSATNGIYRIDSDGPTGNPPYDTYCDMTGGGWTLVADQDATMDSLGRTNDGWTFVEDTAPNGGQWSRLYYLYDFATANGYRFSLRWGAAQDRFINWDQTTNPTEGPNRGVISNVTMVPSGQVGYGGAFQGLALDFAQQATFLDGEPSVSAGAWAVGAIGGSIRAYKDSSEGALTTTRVRLYVKRLP